MALTRHYAPEYDILPAVLSRDVAVEFLMPNGLFLRVDCSLDSPLSSIKSELWKSAQHCPLYHRLLEPGRYSFVFINGSAEQEEVVDEERLLREVRPYASVLRLVERKGDREEKITSAKISMLIGKGLFEFTAMEKDNTEVRDFRKKMIELCSAAVKERNSSPDKQLLYAFPPVLETTRDLPPHVRAQLSLDQSGVGTFLIHVALPRENQSYTFSVRPDMLPFELVVLVLRRKARTLKIPQEDPKGYVLKVSGHKDYLLAEEPLGMYKYIRKCIAKAKRPQLILVSCKELMEQIEPEKVYMPSRREDVPTLPPKSANTSLSLTSIRDAVRLKVIRARGVNISDKMKVSVKFGLYHGAEPLCELVQTRCILPLQDFNEDVIFNLLVQNLPRDARLCCVFNMVDDRKHRIIGRRRDDRIAIAWCNTTMFDCNGQLRMGTMKLGFWPISDEGLDDETNSIGTTVNNPSTDAIQLEIEFNKFSQTVIYPDLDKLLEVVALSANESNLDVNHQLAEQRRGSDGASSRLTQTLQEIANRDALQELCQQDKELVWSFRWSIRDNIPTALPKVLASCRWNSIQHVAQFRQVLQVWELVPPSTAIELLQHTSGCSAVRACAVKSLDQLQDAELAQYLLQLVQALKYESYLDCALARFLLRRALHSQHIGHFFFWHLRAEMHNPEVAVRYGLMLEAYCRGCPSHMEKLSAQVNAICKLRELTEMLRTNFRERRDANDILREMLQSRSRLSSFVSPLDPSILLQTVRYERCRVFDSKMRPLLLSFETEDKPTDSEDDIQLIFKSGDDLRQDMLTLQMLHLMNSIWEQNGLDLRMTVYGVLSTGDNVGVIEVVRNAETLAQIHKTRGGATAALTDKALLEWLKSHNGTDEALKTAVNNFRNSCAGYCVATYVLGIGDRHSDNIMVKRTGELLHIDFGHFLGNFKSKFGVRRERVPFVLTNDFLYVIMKGMSQSKQDEQTHKDQFLELCVRAYMMLREKADLFLSLFMAMLSTGIPELRSFSDTTYLQQTLVLGTSEENARKHFLSRLSEAMGNQLSTRINWLLHNMARDN